MFARVLRRLLKGVRGRFDGFFERKQGRVEKRDLSNAAFY
jgi:hypothetical protein